MDINVREVRYLNRQMIKSFHIFPCETPHVQCLHLPVWLDISVSETLNVILRDISLLPFFVLSLKHTTSYSLLLLHLEIKIISLIVNYM